MRTRYGEISEDDIQTLEYKLRWYMKYGSTPSEKHRETSEARCDYGLQYERFVGHIFSEHGFSVCYQGAKKGVEDGGIDLIARAPFKIRLIQCKRWRIAVNTDVISRLHGAVERFIWEERRGKTSSSRLNISGVIATSGEVESDAEELARHEGIHVMKKLAFQPYPAIKGQRIIADGGRFLMPWDSGYDGMALNFRRGDRFLASVREALTEGFYYPPYHGQILRRLYGMRAAGEA